QLGGVDAAAMFPRPVRAAVADGMPGKTAPVLLLRGSIQKDAAKSEPNVPSIGRVTVLGVDERFKPDGVEAGVDWSGTARHKRGEAPVVLAHRVAAKLGVMKGDRVRLGVPRFSDLPRSSSLAKRSNADATATDPFTVAA